MGKVVQVIFLTSVSQALELDLNTLNMNHFFVLN